MMKRVFLAVLFVLVLAGILGGIKAMQIKKMIAAKSASVMPPTVVNTANVRQESWVSSLTAVGTLTAVQGVTVSAETPGKVTQIAFTAGSRVKDGELLLRQDTSTEEAQLMAATAAADLAKHNFDRYAGLLAQKNIAQALFDDAEAKFKQARAEVDAIVSVIAKKTIKAPFPGLLGLRQVNLGQMLKEGTPIVLLQSLDPLFVEFFLPQHQLGRIAPGMVVQIKADSLPDRVMEGVITTIDPEVDEATRNVKVQATLSNSDELLRPGLFVNVEMMLPGQREVLVIPATAVLYAPYGDSIFTLRQRKNEKSGKEEQVLNQQFVKLGERRGDFVTVLSGLQAGETIVSTGVFKLRNGQTAVVNNELAPEFQLTPRPQNN